MKKARLCAAVAVMLLAASSFGATYKVTFEDQRFFTANVDAPFAHFSNGEVVQNSYLYQGLRGNQYASWHTLPGYSTPCTPCLPNKLTMTFDVPVDNLTLTLVHNGPSYEEWFDLIDDKGNHLIADLGCQYYCTPQVAYPNPARFIWPIKGVKKLTISQREPTWWTYAVDDVSYSVPPQYGIVARLGSDPDAADAPAPVPIALSGVASIPLGWTFSIRLKQKNGLGNWVDVPARFDLGAAFVQDTATVPNESLFPSYVAFKYNALPNPATALFQSIRVGTVPLTITPDGSLPAVQMQIATIVPYTLGEPTAENGHQWDGIFSGQASIRGIPPQFTKAIGFHESRFNTRAWRYEPSNDRNVVAPYRADEDAPHSDYRLPSPLVDGGLSLGAWICPQTINSRGCIFSDMDDLAAAAAKLYYKRNGALFHFPGIDVNRYITIHEICDGNVNQGWTCPDPLPPLPPPVNRPPRSRPSRPPLDPWNQTAMPHEASSYGIMQTTWFSVVDRVLLPPLFNGAGDGLHKNPSLLFDDLNNIARGTASVITGPNLLRLKVMQEQGIPASLTPDYDTPDAYMTVMHDSIRRYNGRGTQAERYINAVWPLVPRFMATFAPTSGIFSDCSGAPVLAGDVTSGPIVPGGIATLSVDAPGASYYQWYVGTAGDTSNPIPNSDASFIQVTPSTTTSYWVEASNACGSTRSFGTVNVGANCAPPQFTYVTDDATVVRGTRLTLQALTNGTNTYAWAQQVDGGAWTAIANVTGAQLEVTPQVTTTYLAAADNGCEILQSRRIVVTVTPCDDVAITQQPSGSTITAGLEAPLTVAVAGTSPITVDWWTTTGAHVSTGTSIRVTPQQTTSYYAVVANACSSGRSQIATVTVQAACVPPQVTTQPTDATITAGLAADLSVAVSGTLPTVAWYTAAGIPAGSGTSIHVTPAQTTSYYASVTNGCGTAQSSLATVSVLPVCPSITATTQTPTPTGAILAVNASGSALQYGWYASDPAGAPWTLIAGATQPSLTVAPSATTADYYARVSNACGVQVSPTFTVDLTPSCNAPAITTDPTSNSYSAGVPATLEVVATGTNLSFQWYQSDPDGSAAYVPITGATSFRLTILPASPTVSYYVTVTNDCGFVQSQAATLTLRQACVAPVITQQPASPVYGPQGTQVQLSVTASGDAPFSFQWYQSDAVGGAWTPVAGATADTILPVVNGTTYYYVHVTNACGAADSDYIQVTPISSCASPQITVQPRSQSLQQQGQVLLSVTASGDGLAYQWFQSTSATSGWTAIPTGTTASIRVTPQFSPAYYYVRVSGTCGAVNSTVAQIRTLWLECPPPMIYTIPGPGTFTPATGITITLDASGSGLTYQWFVADPFGSAVLLKQSSPSNVFSYTTSSGQVAISARVLNDCGSYSDSQGVWVYSNSTVCTSLASVSITPVGGTTITAGGPGVDLSVTASAPGCTITYQWFIADPGYGWLPISGPSSPMIHVNPPQSEYYKCEVTTSLGTVEVSTAVYVQ